MQASKGVGRINGIAKVGDEIIDLFRIVVNIVHRTRIGERRGRARVAAWRSTEAKIDATRLQRL
jgi:hypothetical protein